MQWFWIALAAPALWGLVNHVDKYIISKYFTGKGVGSLVLFTSLSGFIFSIFIVAFDPSVLHFGTLAAIVIAINGTLLVASFIPYLHALEREDASMITALFQLIPIFGYFLALIFLGEHLTQRQLLASSLVVIGSIVISLDLSGKMRFKSKPFFLMILSAFMIAINALIFKIIALQENFWGTAFWEYVGGTIFGLLLFCFIKLYRTQFLATIAQSRVKVLALNSISELLNIFAKLLANFASLLAPLALVWVVNGFQPFIVFIYGLILTFFFPQISRETIDRKTILQKAFSIVLIFAGVYFLLT
jgi:drug/metabolite transporter (DMT)-like permease